MNQFSDRDRWGAFAHRKKRDICNRRVRARRVLLLLTVCLLTCAASFASVYQPLPATSDPAAIYRRTPAPSSLTPGVRQVHIQLCSGAARTSRGVTCLVDGDTGWHDGKKWRLLGADTPELSSPGCLAEYQLAVRAQQRLQILMAGHRIDWTGQTEFYGRHLVRIALSDGRDAGDTLIAEGLAQPWPNRGNVWCEIGGPSTASRRAAQTRNWLRVTWSLFSGRTAEPMAP